MCAVHDYRIHAHQGIGANPAAVQNRAVAHMTMALYHRIAAREAVHHAGVLQVGTLLQDDAAKVATQRRQGADVTLRADDYIADQHGRRVYVRRWVDHRGQAVQPIARHVTPLKMIQ
ncbi:hypothetical protein D3C78_1445340 [compost metagenome]